MEIMEMIRKDLKPTCLPYVQNSERGEWKLRRGMSSSE